MYITSVLFFLACHQGVFCWNTYRVPNSIRHFNFNHEPNPNYEDNSESVNWVHGSNEKTHFNERLDDDHSSRITFPDDDKDPPSNHEPYVPVDKEKNTHSHFILKCIRSCPLNNEYEPVCGTDDITYYNLDFLQCVRECGDDVELQHLSSCDGFAGTSTQSPTTTRTNIDSCVSRCPTTSEYNPVCGTDDVTYKNMGKLSCAQICGVDVEVKRRLPCPKKIPDEDLFTTDGTVETTTVNSRYFQTCMDSCLTTTEYKPVCASNGRTYYNTGKFQCAKSCGLNISIQFLGVCQINQSGESDTVSSTASSTPKPYEVSNKQPISNMHNLLDKIFSNEDTGDPKLDVRHS